jgi:hypothetical protein
LLVGDYQPLVPVIVDPAKNRAVHSRVFDHLFSLSGQNCSSQKSGI